MILLRNKRIWKLIGFNFSVLLFLLLGLIIFSSRAAFADSSVTLMGQVTAGQTDQSVSGALIDIDDTNSGQVVGYAISDQNGNFTISNVLPNTYTIIITPPSGSSYNTVTLQDVDLSQNLSVDVSLTPGSSPPATYIYTYNGSLMINDHVTLPLKYTHCLFQKAVQCNQIRSIATWPPAYPLTRNSRVRYSTKYGITA